MKNLSIVLLIVANLVPFFGVAFFGWSLFSVMFFYWSENIVVGFYNVLKMLKAERVDPLKNSIRTINFGRVSYNNKKPVFISFFLLHYGLFMVGHGIAVFSIFGPSDIPVSVLITGIISLLVSHGVSFFENFIGKKEYKKVSPGDLFVQPYKRLMIMHTTILFGGFIFQVLKLPALSVLFLVTLKTVIDFISHKLEHKRFLKIKKIPGIPIDEEIVQEALGKNPEIGFTIWKKMIGEARKNPGLSKEEMQQRMKSIMKEEFEKEIKSEAEKNKKTHEIENQQDN